MAAVALGQRWRRLRFVLRAEHARVVEEIVGDQRRGVEGRIVLVPVLHHLDRRHRGRDRAWHVGELIWSFRAGQVTADPHGDLAFDT
jgi:hypothetical protein